MVRKKRYTKSQIVVLKRDLLDLLKNNLGILTPSLETLNISTKAYYSWLASDAEFKQEVDNIQNIALDFVESKLLQNIRNGDKASIIFYMKCKGKDRGYIEKQYVEQTTTYTEPMTLRIITPEQHQIEGEQQKQIE